MTTNRSKILLSISFAVLSVTLLGRTLAAAEEAAPVSKTSVNELPPSNENHIASKPQLNPYSKGIEFNIPRLLLIPFANNYYTVSGGFSIFDNQRGAEIAFPIFYREVPPSPNSVGKYSFTTADIHYRMFFEDAAKGFYFGAFLRATYQEGTGFAPSGEASAISTSALKGGGGVGVGFRTTFWKAFYWGMGASVGSYFFNHKNYQFATPDNGNTTLFENNKLILDFEALKVGYLF